MITPMKRVIHTPSGSQLVDEDITPTPTPAPLTPQERKLIDILYARRVIKQMLDNMRDPWPSIARLVVEAHAAADASNIDLKQKIMELVHDMERQ
jgi:hypothetical protein